MLLALKHRWSFLRCRCVLKRGVKINVCMAVELEKTAGISPSPPCPRPLPPLPANGLSLSTGMTGKGLSGRSCSWSGVIQSDRSAQGYLVFQVHDLDNDSLSHAVFTRYLWSCVYRSDVLSLQVCTGMKMHSQTFGHTKRRTLCGSVHCSGVRARSQPANPSCVRSAQVI